MEELIKRLEQATEGSRTLDMDVHEAITPNNWPKVVQLAEPQPCPRYTTSIDTALTLVPEGLNWGVDWRADREQFTALVGEHLGEPVAKSAAVALCIAALKARPH